MKRLSTTTLVAALSLAAAAGVRAQTPRRKTQSPPPKEMVASTPAQVPVDQGRLQGGVYTNDYFGFSFTVKPGWVAMDAATRKSLMEVGKGAVEKGATEQTKAQLDDALSRTAFLISVSKYDVNRPAPEFNAILMCSAERLPTAVIKTGEDYFNAALHVFDGTSTKVELVGRMRAEMLGGAALTVADMKLTVGARVFAQRCYVRVVGEYVLTFIYSYMDEKDLKALDEMMKTVRFK